MPTPENVQALIDTGVAHLKKTTSSYPQMVKKYGSDPAKWPKTSQWYLAFVAFAAARTAVGQISSLTADFSYKEL